ncbi:type II toxin-antitoxin system RelE/ParE family toxin [Ahniella affigens]|uniref:type II toxin-antitoxin system RelE/ParE family toxin n=1 Tax=Ahniella affigens TaxID=2021234 RepID=UPI001F0BD78E|nr:type II toxin-antitoxin system RelE/ParE family toxin [Ahniella affigens]
MAQVVWNEPALHDLDAIADYIGIENPMAAAELVKRVFADVEQLRAHPESDSRPQEIKRSRDRQIIAPPAGSSIAMTVRRSLCCLSCVQSDCFGSACFNHESEQKQPTIRCKCDSPDGPWSEVNIRRLNP